MYPCLGVVNVEIRAEFECPEISWKQVRKSVRETGSAL